MHQAGSLTLSSLTLNKAPMPACKLCSHLAEAVQVGVPDAAVAGEGVGHG